MSDTDNTAPAPTRMNTGRAEDSQSIEGAGGVIPEPGPKSQHPSSPHGQNNKNATPATLATLAPATLATATLTPIREFGETLPVSQHLPGQGMDGTRLVLLTDEEQEFVEWLVDKRDGFNSSRGIQEKRRDKDMTGRQLGILGMMGEFAFCKMENLMPDISWSRFGGFDCWWAGQRVDVKCTARVMEPHLNVAPWKKDKVDAPDLYVLMNELGGGRYRYMGNMRFKEVFCGAFTVGGEVSVPWECLSR